jgi:hypothetical protein
LIVVNPFSVSCISELTGDISPALRAYVSLVQCRLIFLRPINTHSDIAAIISNQGQLATTITTVMVHLTMYYSKKLSELYSTYISDIYECVDYLVQCLDILRESIEYHTLGILLKEFQLGVQYVLHHLIVNTLVDLHKLLYSVNPNDTYNLVAQIFASKGSND